MHRYFLKLAYNGRNYCGWQLQPNAHTVQQELQTALSNYFNENITLIGCGRTDTGVHARQFYAHYDCAQERIEQEEFLYKINKMLPGDIAIQQIYKIVDNLHARFSAKSRTYKYYISREKDPFLEGQTYYFYGPLDVNLMNTACQLLLSYKDFSAFSKSNTQVNNNLCDVAEAHWAQEGHLLVFTITANRFLRNMVRAIVGTLMKLGRNKMTIEEFREVIEKGQRSNAGKSAPAQGLFLHEVKYPEGALNG